VGLQKLLSTAAQVEVMQKELQGLQVRSALEGYTIFRGALFGQQDF
jgi:hypothetical protein